MAVTEITKILFRRGREADRRTLESFGGLAQGEPGFTSSAGWSTDLPGGGAAPNRYYIDSGNNIRSMELHPEDVTTWGNNGGGDFFIGGSGGSDVYIGGASAEKHWQRYFVSLRGTKCNTTWENNTDTAGVDGFVDGTFEIGRAGYGQSSTNNDLNDEWDVNLWGHIKLSISGMEMWRGSTKSIPIFR